MSLRVDYPKRIGPVTLTTGAVSLFAAPTRVRLYYLALSNFSAGAVTATVYLVPAGGAAANANAFIVALSIAGNDLVIPAVDLLLEQGDMLQALAGSGSAINLTASVTDQEHV